MTEQRKRAVSVKQDRLEQEKVKANQRMAQSAVRVLYKSPVRGGFPLDKSISFFTGPNLADCSVRSDI